MKKNDREKRNIVLADCDEAEIIELVDGLECNGVPFIIKSHIANWKRTGKISEMRRYAKYFFTGFQYFLHRRQYNMVVGWQQFYALIFSFFCALFHVKKTTTVVALNFTYKEKKGKLAKVYLWFMKKCVSTEYMDYLHVLSAEYADEISKRFSFPRNRILVTPFGVNDSYEKFKKLLPPCGYQKDQYALAIGRSNRDYDFLLQAWEKVDFPLVIISDTYDKSTTLPNVTIYRDIAGEDSYPWIANCGLMVIPIDDGNLCSGDTVLLSAMATQRKILVTVPSTLAEMYVENGETALLSPKEPDVFQKVVSEALYNSRYAAIGEQARAEFKKKYSRKKMGQRLANMIKELELEYEVIH